MALEDTLFVGGALDGTFEQVQDPGVVSLTYEFTQKTTLGTLITSTHEYHPVRVYSAEKDIWHCIYTCNDEDVVQELVDSYADKAEEEYETECVPVELVDLRIALEKLQELDPTVSEKSWFECLDHAATSVRCTEPRLRT